MKVKGNVRTCLHSTIYILILTYYACEVPLEPVESTWVIVAGDFDRMTEKLTVSDAGIVYFISYDPAVLYKYENGIITQVLADTSEGADFRDIDYSGGSVWVAASKVNPNYGGEGEPRYLSYLIRVYYTGEYEEIYQPTELWENGGGAESILTDGDVCWMINDSTLFKYDHSVENWSVFPGIAPVSAMAHDENSDLLYVMDGAENSGDDMFVWITDDDGTDWVKEPLKINGGIYELRHGLPVGGCLNGDVYIIVNIRHNDVEYGNSLVRRLSGSEPGSGVYEIAFMHPNGPYFYNPDLLAFNDERGDGYYCGPQTSIYYNGSDWLKETVTNSGISTFYDLAAGPDKYWAIVKLDNGPFRLAYRGF